MGKSAPRSDAMDQANGMRVLTATGVQGGRMTFDGMTGRLPIRRHDAPSWDSVVLAKQVTRPVRI